MLNKYIFPKFNPDAYTIIASSDLVVYAIYYLQNHGIDITHEDIISACFMLFPKKFSLKKYPQWPDSAMINRRWSDCRSKGYIAAKTDPGFKLTAKGSRHAEKIAKTLGVATPKKIKPSQVKKTSGTTVKKTQHAPAKKKPTVPVIEVTKAIVPSASITKVEFPHKKQEKKARTKPSKKVLVPPVSVINAPITGQRQKEKAIARPVPVTKTHAHKQKRIAQIKPAKKVLPTPVIKAPKARPKAIVPPAPVAKVESPRKKQAKKVRTKPVQKLLPAPVTEAPKAKNKRKAKVIVRLAPRPVAKAKLSRAKQDIQAQPVSVKKVLPVPVAEAGQEQKAKIKQKTKADVPPVPVVARKKSLHTKQEKTTLIKPARKVVPAPVIKAPKARQEQKAKAIVPSPRVKQKKKTQTAPAKIFPPSQPVQPLKARSKKPTKGAIPIWKEGISLPAPVVITQEAKVRAGKFVRMMETSDAFTHYRKNGTNSSISEFDFRSLLICTMESSPETLARNVELFKGYAGIHNRQDLVTFLAFCSDKFSHLFLPQKKTIRKTR